MEYDVLWSQSIGVLVERVNEYLEDGWLLRGEVFLERFQNLCYFHQAMIRPKYTKESK